MAVRGTTVAGPSETASAILDIAERLVQCRGFNGFSYADIAAELGITKASLHYHFPGKAELGDSPITRYAARFAVPLALRTSSMRTAASPAPCWRSTACACAECWPRNTRLCQIRCAALSSRFLTTTKGGSRLSSKAVEL